MSGSICTTKILHTCTEREWIHIEETGPGGESLPQNVVRVRVDPSVTSIPAGAFEGRKKLTRGGAV
jgi:glyoxylate carboligase